MNRKYRNIIGAIIILTIYTGILFLLASAICNSWEIKGIIGAGC